MTVGLFVPCFIEQYYPRIAIATLDLLEKYGCDVDVPGGQTCCGQPLANAGFESTTTEVTRRFQKIFESYDYVVTPSASCALHVVDHYPSDHPEGETRLSHKTYEICQFLHNVLKIDSVDARLDRRVGIHAGCHGHRGLRLGPASEIQGERPDIIRSLLQLVEGIEIMDLDRADECCGFGGTFSVGEEAVSVKMGKDRLVDHQNAGAEIIASADMSCLMHLEGISKKRGEITRFYHVAEILNGSVL